MSLALGQVHHKKRWKGLVETMQTLKLLVLTMGLMFYTGTIHMASAEENPLAQDQVVITIQEEDHHYVVDHNASDPDFQEIADYLEVQLNTNVLTGFLSSDPTPIEGKRHKVTMTKIYVNISAIDDLISHEPLAMDDLVAYHTRPLWILPLSESPTMGYYYVYIGKYGETIGQSIQVSEQALPISQALAVGSLGNPALESDQQQIVVCFNGSLKTDLVMFYQDKQLKCMPFSIHPEWLGVENGKIYDFEALLEIFKTYYEKRAMRQDLLDMLALAFKAGLVLVAVWIFTKVTKAFQKAYIKRSVSENQ